MSGEMPEQANPLVTAAMNPWLKAVPAEGELALEMPLLSVDDSPENTESSLQQRIVHVLGAPVRAIAKSRIGIGNVISAGKEDYNDSEDKARTRRRLLGAVAVIGAGATRAPSVVVPYIATHALQYSHSPVEAGLATGMAFGAWCFTTSEALNNGASACPSAVEAIGDNFSTVVRNFGNALPGAEAAGINQDRNRRLGLARAIGEYGLTHARRGLTAFTVGILPYAVSANVNGQPRSAIRKLSFALAIDGGLVIGGTSAGLAEVGGGNTALWYGVAGALMVAEWTKNKFRSRQAIAKEEVVTQEIS